MNKPTYKTLEKRCKKQADYFHKLHTEYSNMKADYENKCNWTFLRRLEFLVRGK